MSSTNVKRPCIGCVYFPYCGSTTRTAPCKGRVTKRNESEEHKNVNKK